MDKKEKSEAKKALDQAKRRLPQTFEEAAADFEKFKIEEIKRSRKIAWCVAGAACVVAILSICAWCVASYMRVEPEPVVMHVDKATGATMVLRSVRDAKDQYDEVVNKYWLAQYIQAREGYDWYTISTQYEATKLMSDTDIAKEYEREVQALTAPLKTLKDKGKIVVKIASIVFMGDGTAQVRYTSEKVSLSGENLDKSPEQKWIASVAFQFKPQLKMTEQERLINPLGFKAASYRRDPEVVK